MQAPSGSSGSPLPPVQSPLPDLVRILARAVCGCSRSRTACQYNYSRAPIFELFCACPNSVRIMKFEIAKRLGPETVEVESTWISSILKFRAKEFRIIGARLYTVCISGASQHRFESLGSRKGRPRKCSGSRARVHHAQAPQAGAQVTAMYACGCASRSAALQLCVQLCVWRLWSEALCA